MHLAILGACGHGKVVADAALASGWKQVSFFDDAWPGITANGPWTIVGDTKSLIKELHAYEGVVVAIGDNAIRATRQSQLAQAGAKLVTIVHPAGIVSPYAIVGSGSVVLANGTVNACATLGEGVIVNTGAVIEHDCVIGDFSHVSPNAVLAGGVTLEECVWVGACASIRQLLRVGEASVVGMGAVVTKSVPSGSMVVGNPADDINT